MRFKLSKESIGYLIITLLLAGAMLVTNTIYAKAAITDFYINRDAINKDADLEIIPASQRQVVNTWDDKMFEIFWKFQEYNRQRIKELKQQEMEIPVKVSDAMKSPYSDTNWPHEELNANLLSQVNGYFNTAGMPAELYDAAMDAEWQEIENPNNEKPKDWTFDISQQHTYADLEKYITNFGKYDYVKVYDMGKTNNNRSIYNIEIFNPSPDIDPSEAVAVMIIGGAHAKETMGPHAAIKMAEQTIKSMQVDNILQEKAQWVCVTILPCLNPDGYELVRLGDADRKSNAEGIDLNRNTASINAGCQKNSFPIGAVASKAGLANYHGDYLGQAYETRIAMKWINHYIINGNAVMLIDMHQQGNGIYVLKEFGPEESIEAQKEFYNYIKGIIPNYKQLDDGKYYGYNGTGGTLTDYAWGVAMGFPYSAKYGRQVLIANGVEAPLLEMSSLNDPDFKKYINPIRPGFVFATLEMGADSSYLGFSDSALNKQATHYEKHNFKNLIPNLMIKALEIKK
jgi:hypothetical protein